MSEWKMKPSTYYGNNSILLETKSWKCMSSRASRPQIGSNRYMAAIGNNVGVKSQSSFTLVGQKMWYLRYWTCFFLYLLLRKYGIFHLLPINVTGPYIHIFVRLSAACARKRRKILTDWLGSKVSHIDQTECILVINQIPTISDIKNFILWKEDNNLLNLLPMQL